MKYKCRKCGKECEDNYYDINKFNNRIWCDECVDIILERLKQNE